MLNRSLVPALNYGPLVENGSRHDALEFYQDIDRQILAALRQILRLGADVSDEEVRAFAIARKCDGGLEFMLPGEYFHVMMDHGDALIYGDPTGQLKKEYFDSFYYHRHNFVPPDKPPVAAVLPYADLLTDTQFTKLVNFYFGGRVPPERCPICGKTGTHDPKCTDYMDMVWKVHNDALAYLLGSMQGNRTATRRQTPLNGGRHLSDGFFTGKDGNIYTIDASVAWNGDLHGRYRQKMTHAEAPEFFIPFVFSMDGKIHPESRRRIQAVAPEITDDVLSRATLIPLATRQADRITVVARESLGDLSQMIPEVSVHWSDPTTQPNHVEVRPAQEARRPAGEATPTDPASSSATQASKNTAQASQIQRASQPSTSSDKAALASQSGLSLIQGSAQPTLEPRTAGPEPRNECSQIEDGAPWSSLSVGIAALSASISNVIAHWLQQSGPSPSGVSRRSETSPEQAQQRADTAGQRSERSAERQATNPPTQSGSNRSALPAGTEQGQRTERADPPAENANRAAGANPPTNRPGGQEEEINITIDVSSDQPAQRRSRNSQPTSRQAAGHGKQSGHRQRQPRP